jgi:Na+-transporting NADH:ubiquinone oxidoreductase subunit C
MCAKEGGIMRKDNLYTFFFAAMVCVVCGLLLSMASKGLQERQEMNRKLDRQKNILKAFQVLPETAGREEILKLYNTRVKSIRVDKEGEKIAENATPAKGLEVFQLLNDNGSADAYAIPVEGKGLWSTIKGFMALDKHVTAIVGLTFYEHGETPGLGGEIEKESFTSQFKGKTIWSDNGDLASVAVAKGPVASSGLNPDHAVDGISGATLTGNGVSHFLKQDLLKYLPFFNRIKGGQS